jgi:hypothetical protein
MSLFCSTTLPVVVSSIPHSFTVHDLFGTKFNVPVKFFEHVGDLCHIVDDSKDARARFKECSEQEFFYVKVARQNPLDEFALYVRTNDIDAYLNYYLGAYKDGSDEERILAWRYLAGFVCAVAHLTDENIKQKQKNITDLLYQGFFPKIN